MPDQALQFIRRVPMGPAKKSEIFGNADFVPVDTKTIDPDTTLRQFGIVELSM